MADKTPIEWCDATWNVVTGCSRISPGCENCYAERLAGTRMKNTPSRIGLTRETKHGPVWTGEIRVNDKWLHDPLHWRKPRRVFVAAHGDLFHEKVSFNVLDILFSVMEQAPQHQFQVLTKRPERMTDYATMTCNMGGLVWPPMNVWWGVSVEDRARMGRINVLRDMPGPVRFLSLEPLLEDLGTLDLTGIDWVIVGGESGPGARPMHPDWVRSIRDQCVAAGVPFFFKQHGDWREALDIGAGWTNTTRQKRDGTSGPFQGSLHGPGYGEMLFGGASFPTVSNARGDLFVRVGKKRAGRALDGETWDQMPA